MQMHETARIEAVTLAEPESMLAAALNYAARGWRVFPCQPKSKAPLTVHGVKDASTDFEQIAAWWAKWPLANVAIATGAPGPVVVDVDGEQGGESWYELRHRLGFADDTPVAHTAKGQHLYFGAPHGVEVRNSASKAGPGVDIRGAGGYVIAPPSIHPSGKPYTWDAGFHFADYPLAPFPEALLPILTGPRAAAKTAGGNGDGGRIPEGQRDSTLTSLAGTMRRRGMGEAAIRAALLAENAARCDPPLPEAEVRGIAASVSRYPSGESATAREQPPKTQEPEPDPAPELEALLLEFPRTDAGNAEAFAAISGDRFRFECRAQRWLQWSGAHWQEDADGAAERAVLAAMRQRRALYAKTEDTTEARKRLLWALSQESRPRLLAALLIARALEPFVTRAENLDADPWLLACPNGTLDLRTGELRPSRCEDMITRLTGAAFDPTATCPRWLRFLGEVFGDDADLIAFLQRAVGYSLTGDIREHALFILHGTGANGKTTFTEAIRFVLGDYARATPFSTFESGNRDEKRVDLAALRGVRFVSASEAEDNRRLAEARVKAVTGGDVISCRRLYGDFFEYTPSFKIWLATNYKPEIRGTDLGIWRRLRLIPFARQFTGAAADPMLLETLKGERAGILGWAVQGCLRWRQQGLGSTEAVQSATEAYRAEQDTLGVFLDECTEQQEGATVRAGELFARYKTWADASGEKALTANAFSRRLTDRGIDRVRNRQSRLWVGIRLLRADDDDGKV